jgi:hypothetical protein
MGRQTISEVEYTKQKNIPRKKQKNFVKVTSVQSALRIRRISNRKSSVTLIS